MDRSLGAQLALSARSTVSSSTRLRHVRHRTLAITGEHITASAAWPRPCYRRAQDLGSSEIFPSYLRHNSNGRFVVVCGDGEYVVYTALAWRNKSFGTGAEFVWAADANDFAVRQVKPDAIKVYKNFKARCNAVWLRLCLRCVLAECGALRPSVCLAAFVSHPCVCCMAVTRLQSCKG
jgi:Coatomer WD associated region